MGWAEMLIARSPPRPVYLDKYRTLSRDSGAGNPLLVFSKGGQVERLRAYWAARVGTYWTVPVLIPLRELRNLHAQIHTDWRLQQVCEKMRRGVDLDPIELGLFRNGCARGEPRGDQVPP